MTNNNHGAAFDAARNIEEARAALNGYALTLAATIALTLAFMAWWWFAQRARGRRLEAQAAHDYARLADGWDWPTTGRAVRPAPAPATDLAAVAAALPPDVRAAVIETDDALQAAEAVPPLPGIAGVIERILWPGGRAAGPAHRPAAATLAAVTAVIDAARAEHDRAGAPAADRSANTKETNR